jgi:predicted site-specific integrase-resolvase
MNPATFAAGGMSLQKWCEQVGIDRITAYRWRIAGMLQCSANILGNLYLTREDDETFWKRARAGEFTRELKGIVVQQKEKR